MGFFGLFIFLSVLVFMANWRSVQVARLRQEVMLKMVESGQELTPGHLEVMLNNPYRHIAMARLKIGILVCMGIGAILLSMVFWSKGTFPILVAGLFALAVAFVTWSNEKQTPPAADQ